MRNRTVLVLGSHRSGSSVLARALAALGIDLGSDLVRAGPDNPRGYFEDQITQQLDDDFLKEIHCRWDTIALPENIVSYAVAAYQSALKEKVFKRFEGKRLWCLKDPRISRLWRFWLPVFVETGVEPIFVLSNRHPFSVASSLVIRNQMPEVQALALWAVYNLDALDALLLRGGLVVDYDLMMDRPHHELQRIANFLGEGSQLDVGALAKFESDFLTDDLRHYRFAVETAALAASPLQMLCLEVHSELLKLAKYASGLPPETLEQTRTLVSRFRSQLARSMEWMQAIDAFQATLANCTKAPLGAFACAQIYFSEFIKEVPQIFTEARSFSTHYPISRQRQTLRLDMPVDIQPIARVRLDPANQPLTIFFHTLTLALADGTLLWRWGGGLDAFRNVDGLAFRDRSEGLLCVCLTDDPQFEIIIPEQVLAHITSGAYLEMEITASPLLEGCADVIRADDRLIAELRADDSSPGAASHEQDRLSRLKGNLETIAALLKSTLSRRDQAVGEQSKRLVVMRDELLRAEAQLDLLKDVMLNGREKDRL